MVAKASGRKLTLIASDDSAEDVRMQMSGKDLVEVDIIIRSPDGKDLGDRAVAARLCSCRRVCLAFVEPDAF